MKDELNAGKVVSAEIWAIFANTRSHISWNISYRLFMEERGTQNEEMYTALPWTEANFVPEA